MKHEVSVIVPTFNGAKKIETLLNALLQQSLREFELIIAIDGSTDNTAEVISKYKDKFQCLVTVWQENKGRAAIRNKGAKEATGEVLIFYDDDTQPDSQSVYRHLEAFKKNGNAIVGGNAPEYYSPAKSDFQNYKAYLTHKWTAGFTNEPTQLSKENGFLAAANMSIPSPVFTFLNGFDERLRDAEDYDLAWRALDTGIPVYFDKSNEAIHHDSITAKNYVLRLRSYANAHRRLDELYPERKPSRPEKKAKRWIYALFAHPYLLKLIDAEFFRFSLPKPLRFKFYDIVVQALANEFPSKRL